MLQIENDKVNCQYKDVDAEESEHHTYAQFSTYNLLKREGGRGYVIDQCHSRCDSFAEKALTESFYCQAWQWLLFASYQSQKV